MKRHLADHQTSTSGARLKRFVEVEKAQAPEGSHPASRTLAKRPKDRDEARRVREFVRIDRGRTA